MQQNDKDQNSESSINTSLIEQADRIESLYKAFQSKFDVLEQLDRHGDVNDPVFLRSELQRNSFLLAHERVNSNRRSTQVQELLESQKNKHNETKMLSAKVTDLSERLKFAHSQLYDISSHQESDSSDYDHDNCQGINLDDVSSQY